MSDGAGWHLHPCESCGLVWTCRGLCPGKATNGRCSEHSSGHPRVQWNKSRDPVECCRSSARLMTKTEVTAAGILAGTKSWYRCRSCGRYHPFNPARPT